MKKTNEKNRSGFGKFVHYSVYALALATALPIFDVVYDSVLENLNKKEVRYFIDKSYDHFDKAIENFASDSSHKSKNSIDSLLNKSM